MAFQDNIPAAPDPNLDGQYSSYMGSPQDPNEHPVSNLPDGRSYAAEAMDHTVPDTGKLGEKLGSKYKVSQRRKSGRGGRRKK